MNVREGRESYLRTIVQITRERSAAQPIVRALRNSGRDVWDVEIPQSWRTAGFVQELTALAYELLETDPRESLLLAQLALAIATSIPAGTYEAPIQAQIEGTAWREIGTAHKYLSEYDAALRAYDAAQRAFASANSLAHDDAIIDFARAIVLVDLDRLDEARELLEKVQPLFRSFGDKRREVHAKILAGNIYLCEQRWSEARDTFKALLPEVPENDLYGNAIVRSNLGFAYEHMGQYNNAAPMLYAGLQMLTELGWAVEITRTEWSLARLLLMTGEYEKAAAMLERVRAGFLEKTIPEEAGLVGLDLADAWIALGRTADARELVSTILAEFTAAKLNSRALTALAYLRDVLVSTAKPEKAVRHVRTYVERLRSEPSLLFLPLSE
ncbi:MAG TPA: tetratricopeptide repeat protein [Thermoanaerobaculia bacterium]|nr:tetratricopeptide repeat protein [Thermoanaerobaculia bacterium]